jgi:alpha-beta hydrolase superfamily lysophospholipase
MTIKQHTEGRFCGTDGLELYFQCWLPERKLKAVVVLIHGVGEHSGRYMNVVTPLVKDGYDHRGHGRSPGQRVHINNWSEYRGDLKAFLGMVAAQVSGCQIIVYGHSMGSLVVLDHLLQGPDRLSGAIISGAAIEPAGVGTPFQVMLAWFLTRVFPRFYVDLGINAISLSRDPAVQAAFRADPMITGRATVRWVTESLTTIERIKKNMHIIDIPLLVLHGKADSMNCAEGAVALYKAVPNPNKKILIYPGVCHELHNGIGHQEVVTDICDWLDHLTSTGR